MYMNMKKRTIRILILSSFILCSVPQVGHAAISVTAEILGSCGNNLKEIYEDCDGTDFGSSTCESIGYATGTLGCSDVCTYNRELCISPVVETTSQSGIQSGGSVTNMTDGRINYSNVTFSGITDKNGLVTITRNQEVIAKINTFVGNEFTYVDSSVVPGIYTYTLIHAQTGVIQSFPIQVRPYQNIQILGIHFTDTVEKTKTNSVEDISPISVVPDTATGTIGIGQIVKINVILPKQNKNIYGFSGVVHIPDNTSFKAIEYKNNLPVQWVVPPVYKDGVVSFQARTPEGYTGVIDPDMYPTLKDANIFTIVLESKKSGTTHVVSESELYPSLRTNIFKAGESSYTLSVSTYRYEDPAKEQYGTTTSEQDVVKTLFTKQSLIIVSIIFALIIIGFILRFAI